MPLKTAICDLLGIEVPVLLAGMGGVSYAEVTAAVSNAGGFGCLGMASAGPDEIRREMRRVRELTDKPFGVDLLTPVPDQLERACDVIIEEGAAAFVSGLGVPTAILPRLKAAGLVVMSVVGRVHHARKAEDAGVDAVIAQGTEAGGHTGSVAGMALIPQVVDAVDIPVIAAGGIFDGRGLAAALALGAQGVWVGTRFIASVEARADQAYKDTILQAAEDQTVVTRCYTGKTLRAFDNPYIRDWERRPQDLKPFPEQAIHSIKAGVIGGIGGQVTDIDPSKDCLPMGQGCGAIHEVLPAAEIVRRMVAEARGAITLMAGLAG
ncbi:MAG: nitronate monooxygenase [Alphaproteobacteria bacterium]|nr:nitronate monooxygenase [Alphaproteobacteria bacterium]